MGTYLPNPPRRCGGSKAPNSSYLEGGDFSPDGALHSWSWLLGDGLNRNIVLGDRDLPPRQVVGVDPILTVLFESYMTADGPPVTIPKDLVHRHTHLSLAMKSPGIADHVGDQFYSAWNFYLETAMFGPSRKVSKPVAKVFAELVHQRGPIPMIFAHNKIPSFRSEVELWEGINLIVDVLGETITDFDHRYFGPTWLHDHWGMYARRGHWIGDSHFMLPVLGVIDELKENWQIRKDQPGWKEMRKFFNGLRYVKQTFGCAWLCRVSYTLPASGEPDEEMLELPGINVIDLAQVREVVISDEQAEEAPVGAD